jgi:hypothetical protein
MTRGKVGLLLAAGAAAYGAYRLSKMTPEQKSNLRTKGKDLFDKSGIGNLFNRKTATSGTNGNNNF